MPGDADDYGRFDASLQLGGGDLRTKDSQGFVAAGSGKGRDSIDGGLPLGSQTSQEIGAGQQVSPSQNIDAIMAQAQIPRRGEIDIQDELEIDVGPDAQPPMHDDYVDSRVDRYPEESGRADAIDYDEITNDETVQAIQGVIDETWPGFDVQKTGRLNKEMTRELVKDVLGQLGAGDEFAEEAFEEVWQAISDDEIDKSRMVHLIQLMLISE